MEQSSDTLTDVNSPEVRQKILEKHPYFCFIKLKTGGVWKLGLAQTSDDRSIFLYDVERIEKAGLLGSFLEAIGRWWQKYNSKCVPFELFAGENIGAYHSCGTMISMRSIDGEPEGFIFDLERDYQSHVKKLYVEIV